MNRLITAIQNHLEIHVWAGITLMFAYVYYTNHTTLDSGSSRGVYAAITIPFLTYIFGVATLQCRDAYENEWKPAHNK